MKQTPPPLNPNARKWVDALRSGQYYQARGVLHSTKGGTDSFCCLGVACDLYVAETGLIEPRLNNVKNLMEYDGKQGVLPNEVRDWLGLSTDTGSWASKDVAGPFGSLTSKNDNGMSFGEIADIIESQPAGLFK